MQRRLLAGLIPLAFALASPVQADIYAFVDSNGVRHLSNVPSDPRYKLVMRTPTYSKKAAQPSSYAPNNLYAPGVTLRNYAQKAARIKPSRVNEQNRQRFSADVNRIAAQYRLEPALMHAVISAESAYNPWAVSPKGAMGLMQLMPGTAERFGVGNAYDPIANMHGGARYLRWLLDRFNDTQLAVAAYNAGEGAVQKYGNQIPPYKETQTYVVRVLNFYQQYRLGGLYHTGAKGDTVAFNRSYPGNSSGVTIITPRTSGRFARTPVKVNTFSSTATSRPYLTPTSDRVIIGNSNGGRNSIRSSAQLAGNDK
ncbi:MAG: lytic transglycosylase domain-containing protein [Gammaproteobacteria bacterium]|nr:lytic transglycosylase domain-containing protein [Gammaproteobacteria bacterium]MCP5196146.1 lytic transglycosylase domain-containing protein [Gammaproteobacteria bacterium]